MLYFKMRNQETCNPQILKWGAIAAVSFVFSLWVKHFIFNLYALPIDLANPVLVIGLLNSGLTILAAAIILLATLAPVIRTQTAAIKQENDRICFCPDGCIFCNLHSCCVHEFFLYGVFAVNRVLGNQLRSCWGRFTLEKMLKDCMLECYWGFAKLLAYFIVTFG